MKSSPETDAKAAALFALLPFAALTVVVTVATVGKTSRLLTGLTYFVLPSSEAEKARARLAKATAARRKDKRRKPTALESIAKSDENDAIASLRLTKADLLLRPFWKHFDHLVFFTILVTVNWLAAEARAQYLVRTTNNSGTVIVLKNPLLPLMCLFGTGSAARALVLMELDKGTPAVEKTISGVVAVLGFLVSFLILSLVPSNVLDFEIDRTSVEFAPAVIGFIKRKAGKALGRVPGLMDIEVQTLDVSAKGSLVVSKLQIALGLSVFAGILCGALFPPAVRASRSYLAVTAPPRWSSKIVRASFPNRIIAHVAFASPSLACAAFFLPELREVSCARPVLLLAVGLFTLLSVPTLVQGHLNGALITWYELKNGELARGDGANTRPAARSKADVTIHVVAKVAVQAASPACLLVCLACLLGSKRVDGFDDDSLTGMIPAVCWRTVAGYLGWWSCGVWGLFITAGVVLGRTGVPGFTQ